MSYESANPCPLPALRIRFPTGPLSDSLPGKDAPAALLESGRRLPLDNEWAPRQIGGTPAFLRNNP